MDDGGATTVLLRWGRGDARFVAWFDACLAAMFLIGIPLGIAEDRPAAGLGLAALALAPGWTSRRAFRVLRSPDPALTLRERGVELVHPMLQEPLAIAAPNVHSLWMGPFEQSPRTRQDFWFGGRRRFPADVLDVSDCPGPDDGEDQLVLAFSRALDLRPPLRLPVVVWVLHRTWPKLLTTHPSVGLVARVRDRDEAMAMVESSGLTGSVMPSDVRDWLS